MQSSKTKIWQPLLFSLCLLLGMAAGMNLRQPTAPSTEAHLFGFETSKHHNILQEVLGYIDAKYVDKIETDKLSEKAVNAILNELDPHSAFIPARDLQEVNEQMEGNFEGVGIEFSLIEDTILVVSAIVGGPSHKVGILPGDKIVEIMDSIVAGKGIASREVVDKLRGKKGTKVKVGILRNNSPKLLHFNITRDEIPLHSLDAAYMLDERTAYIKINRFSATTYTEFMEAVEKLTQKGMKDIVLDLRQNPGGYLTEATKMLNQIIKKRDQLLVYTQGRKGRRSTYETQGQVLFDIDRVAVLVDEGSASASEILAGSIQDLDRGHIIGRRTFGKGLVQEQYELSDGSALRLTVAKYYTPSGRLIQKPYVKGENDDYESDVEKRYLGGEMTNADSLTVKDTAQYYTTSGRVVHGGGGITPDVFVPFDTLLANSFFIESQQYIPNFAYKKVEQLRATLSKYDAKRFVEEYQIDDNTMADFAKNLKDEGVKQIEKRLPNIAPLLKLRIKAFMAKQLFNNEAFYKILNKEDRAVQIGFDYVRNNKSFSSSIKKTTIK